MMFRMTSGGHCAHGGHDCLSSVEAVIGPVQDNQLTGKNRMDRITHASGYRVEGVY